MKLPLHTRIANPSIGVRDAQNLTSRTADEIVYDEFEDGGRRANEELVYEWLRKEVNVRLTTPILDNFYLARKEGIVGELNAIDELIAGLSDSSMVADSAARAAAISDIKYQNSLLSTNEVFEANAQWINAVYLDIAEKGIKSINPEIVPEIEFLANTCPYLGGNAVYRARTVLSLFKIKLHYDELELCNGQGVYKGGISKLQQQLNSLWASTSKTNPNVKENQYLVYPNPAQSFVNIEYSGMVAKQCSFSLIDMLGRVRLQTSLSGEILKTVVSVQALEPGIYLYQIQDKDGHLQTGKLSIE